MKVYLLLAIAALCLGSCTGDTPGAGPSCQLTTLKIHSLGKAVAERDYFYTDGKLTKVVRKDNGDLMEISYLQDKPVKVTYTNPAVGLNAYDTLVYNAQNQVESVLFVSYRDNQWLTLFRNEYYFNAHGLLEREVSFARDRDGLLKPGQTKSLDYDADRNLRKIAVRGADNSVIRQTEYTYSSKVENKLFKDLLPLNMTLVETNWQLQTLLLCPSLPSAEISTFGEEIPYTYTRNAKGYAGEVSMAGNKAFAFGYNCKE